MAVNSYFTQTDFFGTHTVMPSVAPVSQTEYEIDNKSSMGDLPHQYRFFTAQFPFFNISNNASVINVGCIEVVIVLLGQT